MTNYDIINWDDYNMHKYSNVGFINGRKRFEIMHMKDLGFKAYMYVTPKGCGKECAVVMSDYCKDMTMAKIGCANMWHDIGRKIEE